MKGTKTVLIVIMIIAAAGIGFLVWKIAQENKKVLDSKKSTGTKGVATDLPITKNHARGKIKKSNVNLSTITDLLENATK